MTRMPGIMVALALVVASCGDTATTTVGTEEAPTAAATTLASTTPAPTTQPATTTKPTTTTTTTTTPTTTEAEPEVIDDPAATLLGVWRTRGGVFMRIKDDATWAWELIVGTDSVSEGEYTLEDGVLTITTAAGTDFCREGQTGVYAVAFVTADELDLTTISDDCGSRTGMADDGTLLRHEN